MCFDYTPWNRDFYHEFCCLEIDLDLSESCVTQTHCRGNVFDVTLSKEVFVVVDLRDWQLEIELKHIRY